MSPSNLRTTEAKVLKSFLNKQGYFLNQLTITKEEDEDEDNQFKVIGMGEKSGIYVVETYEVSYEKAKQNIMEHLWAFKPSFLRRHIRYHINLTDESIDKLCRIMQSEANQIFQEILHINLLVSNAIEEDGLGHFLNSYDGSSHEFSKFDNNYVIYRIDDV